MFRRTLPCIDHKIDDFTDLVVLDTALRVFGMHRMDSFPRLQKQKFKPLVRF